jgi:hypothetical protein
MVELIERGAPAVMLCHWPGLYNHGTKEGLRDFQQVVVALEERYRDRTLWMKVSEIARYWAARGLTSVVRDGDETALSAPFACRAFTLRVPGGGPAAPRVRSAGADLALREVKRAAELESGTWLREDAGVTLCFDLPRGKTSVRA